MYTFQPGNFTGLGSEGVKNDSVSVRLVLVKHNYVEDPCFCFFFSLFWGSGGGGGGGFGSGGVGGWRTGWWGG